ncbi:MAG: recombinase zinc beta ribbon domain-containing protein [Bdellovibrionales bacterium]
MLGNLLFGSKTEVEGSKLDDLSVQSSTYGGTIQLVYGTMRVAGNVIWSTKLKETRHESSAGGKGGGGAKQVSYTYSVSFAVGLCAGPVSAIRRIWADTKLIYDASASNTQATEKQAGVIRIHLGTETQKPDSTMEMHLGTGNVPAHRGLCYLVFTDLQLADFSNRIPSISAEVVGSGDMACDATLFPSVSGRYRDGGVIWPSDGTLVGFTANSTIYKYDLINNALLLNVPFDDKHDLYGDLYGFDGEGYFYHASDAYGVGMHLVKRHPETLAVMKKTTSRIGFSVTGSVQGDKILVNRSRKIYSTDFVLLHDLSEVLTSHLDEAPLCEDGDGNIWQISASYAKRVSFNLLGIAEVETTNISSYTGGNNPNAVFWDNTTGYLYFCMNGLGRIIKWDINSGYVAHVDGVQLENGYSLQGDSSRPQNGQFWTSSGTSITLVNLATMRIEKEYDLLKYMPIEEQAKTPARPEVEEDFPLRGFVACAHCGQTLTACWSKGKYRSYPYYFCYNRDCAAFKKSIRKEEIEHSFERLLKTLSPSESMFQMVVQMLRGIWEKQEKNQGRDAALLEKEYGEAEKRIGQIMDRILESDSASLIKVYEDRLKELELHKVELTEKRAKM